MYDDAGEATQSYLQSATGKLRIMVEKEEKLTGDGIFYVKINLVGENGEVECNHDQALSVSAYDCRLLAFGSANPRTEESFLSGTYTTYYGKSLAVVEITGQKPSIEVTGLGLATVCVNF